MKELDRSCSSKIEVDGRDVAGPPVRRRNATIAYQQVVSYGRESLAFPLRDRPRHPQPPEESSSSIALTATE